MAWNGAPKLYKPGAPFSVSRSKIDLFIECPLCLYLDARHGVKRPSGPRFTLNLAVDELLKREFDEFRAMAAQHPLMAEFGIDAVPLKHPKLDEWRENFKGIRHDHAATGLTVFGAVDDLWVSASGEVHVVDYKATAKDEPVESLDDSRWHNQYRRQIEVYQWLLRRVGLRVSTTGYFLYVTGKKAASSFDGIFEFEQRIIPFEGDDSWIDKTLVSLKKCLDSDSAPAASSTCEFCAYRKAARDAQLLKRTP